MGGYHIWYSEGWPERVAPRPAPRRSTEYHNPLNQSQSINLVTDAICWPAHTGVHGRYVRVSVKYVISLLSCEWDL